MAGPPNVLRTVDAFDQHRRLHNVAAGFDYSRPDEAPSSMRLVNRRSPLPSQNRISSVLAFLPRGREQVSRKYLLLRPLLHQRGQPVEVLAHVSAAPDTLSRRRERSSSRRLRSEMCRGTAAGSLPTGAKTRRPSSSSTIVMPSGRCNRSCRTSASALSFPSAVETRMAVIFALSFRPYPNNIRRQNSMLMTNIVVPTDLGGTGVRAIGLMLDRELLLVGKATSVGAFVVRRIDGRRACQVAFAARLLKQRCSHPCLRLDEDTHTGRF
jgi:hypothetical protein